MNNRTKYTISIFILAVLCFVNSFACDCPAVAKLDAAYVKEHKLVFRGSVKSVGECDEINKAHFLVQELYLGDCTSEIDVFFDCTGDCKMMLNPGETWIIYATMAQMGKPKINICSRSRKLVDNEIKLATNFIASDLNFNEECAWLRENIGTKEFIEKNENSDLQHRNELPTKSKSLILIAISFVGLISLYFLLNKFLK